MGLLSSLGGGVIGGAVVKLSLDAKQYQAELAAAEGKTKGATTGMGGAFTKLKAIGVVAWAALATAALAFAADAIKAAEEHQVAVDELNKALGENTDALQKQASALQMVTGFSDEAIMAADTILSRYKLTQSQLQQLNPLLLDYARATGQDVPSAASALGKALLGNARALKAIGINFKATGDTGKDFATIMGALQAKVGGVAVAFGDTAAGKMEILNEKFNELKESIGTALLPVISQLADELGPLTDGLTKVTTEVQNISKVMPDWVKQLFATIVPFHGLGLVLGAIGGAFGGFTDDFNAAVDAAKAGSQDVATSSTAAAFALEDWQQHQRDLAAEIDRSNGSIKRFAGMSGTELKKWKTTVKTSVDSAILDLSNLKGNFGVTQSDLIQGFRAMDQRAHQFANAMKILNSKKENWVPDSLLKFLEDSGPGAVTSFASLSQQKQHEIAAGWKDTSGTLDTVHSGINKLGGAINGIPSQKEINIRVNYTYAGYDQSKPIPGFP